MDVIVELRREHSKIQTTRIVEWVGHDRRRFAELVKLMLGDDRLLAQRASWVVGDCGELHPDLAVPHTLSLLENLARPQRHDAVVRHTFRLLQFVKIPARLEGRVLSVSLAALGGAAPVAVKACVLTVLKRLSARYPEILTEVRALLDEILPAASPAIRARARREFGPSRIEFC